MEQLHEREGVVAPPLTELDAAVLAHRADPSEANRLRALALAEAHTRAFFGRVADEMLEMQRGRGR